MEVMQTTDSTKPVSRRIRWRRLYSFDELGILLALLAFAVLISLINSAFYSEANLVNIARNSAFYFIMGCGMTFCLVGGGLDLAVGSTYGAAGIIGAYALIHEVPVPLSILIGLGTGVAIGLISGMLIVRLNIPPMICTLGMMYAARGVVMVISKGDPFYRFPESFKAIGQGDVLGVPNPIWLAAIYGLICHFVLNNTKFGYAVRAVGGNENAARVSGIRINRIKIWLYVISSFSAGFAGLLMTSRLNSSHPNSGFGYEMIAISAAIIGGTSLFGGIGTIFGTLLGALLINVIYNGIVLMRVDLHWQNIVIGGVIIAAVAVDQMRRQRLWRARK